MEFYHVLNRGVDKRNIFLDSQDYARFVHDMYEFNTLAPALHVGRYASNMVDIVSRPSEAPGKELVDIHGWCLMGNHYHLILSERIENGMSNFLRKLNVGYAKYFNKRYSRVGTLFQGRTKKVHICTDQHLLHILNYVHFNPLDLSNSNKDWRELKIADQNTALNHLLEYKWSSYKDYIGIKNFPSILTTTFFQEIFSQNYKAQVEKYLHDISIDDIQHLTLE